MEELQDISILGLLPEEVEQRQTVYPLIHILLLLQMLMVVKMILKLLLLSLLYLSLLLTQLVIMEIILLGIVFILGVMENQMVLQLLI